MVMKCRHVPSLDPPACGLNTIAMVAFPADRAPQSFTGQSRLHVIAASFRLLHTTKKTSCFGEIAG